MYGAGEWLIDQLKWLMGLADPVKLREFVELGGWWVGYAVLAAVIFSETGLLVGFFLPGDSLLFAAGFLASSKPPVFDLFWLIGALTVAAIVGDAVNYQLGLQMGEHVFEKGRLRFVKHKHLLMAKEFYETYGPLAIVLARFAPLVRTFTPFVAGVARMNYRRFVVYNVAGGAGWVLLMTLAGYWLGQIDFIQRNFEKSVLVVVALSIVVPVAIGALKHRRQAARQRAAEALASADTVEL
jgi:membrane-associated protein